MNRIDAIREGLAAGKTAEEAIAEHAARYGPKAEYAGLTKAEKDHLWYERNKADKSAKMKTWGAGYRSRPDVAERKRKQARQWAKDNPEKRRAYARQRHEKRRARSRHDLWVEQGGCCYLCGEPVPEPTGVTGPGKADSHLDHDHRCCSEKGRSCEICCRGLACRHCNWGIGHFGDDPGRMRRAADALEEAQKRVNARMSGQLELGL